jgi:hypothetical protein
MIVTIGFPIVPAGAIAKIYLVNQSGFLQVAQRIVNSCVADAGQAPASRFEDVAGSRVIVAFLDHLKNRFSLRRQLRFWLCLLHDGFRLILNPLIVNRRWYGSKQRIFSRKLDDLINISLEWWAADAVRSEELLRCGCVVELFDEEVRDGVVR